MEKKKTLQKKKKCTNNTTNIKEGRDGKTWKDWNVLQLWFLKKIVGVIVINWKSFLLFVTFDIMFGRQYISLTRSSDFLIHMHWVISQVP